MVISDEIQHLVRDICVDHSTHVSSSVRETAVVTCTKCFLLPCLQVEVAVAAVHEVGPIALHLNIFSASFVVMWCCLPPTSQSSALLRDGHLHKAYTMSMQAMSNAGMVKYQNSHYQLQSEAMCLSQA